MRYALQDDQKLEPTPKAKAFCQCCNLPVIAKCGKFKVWHWAHKSCEHCDPWWEAETDWHRRWKDEFPKEWQEIIHFDTTGEKHIADVKTDRGLVFEFQHSVLDPKELEAREQFYRNMVWIVDGCRSELDAGYLRVGLSSEPLDLPNSPTAYTFEWWGRSRFMDRWSTAKAPVFLDFGLDGLWQLILYNSKTKRGALRPTQRAHEIKIFLEGGNIPKLL